MEELTEQQKRAVQTVFNTQFPQFKEFKLAYYDSLLECNTSCKTSESYHKCKDDIMGQYKFTEDSIYQKLGQCEVHFRRLRGRLSLERNHVGMITNVGLVCCSRYSLSWMLFQQDYTLFGLTYTNDSFAQPKQMIQSMLLDIRNELQTIRDEVVLMDRVRYKLASQMRQFKEFNQLRTLANKVKQHLKRVETVQEESCPQNVLKLNVYPLLVSNLSIRNRLIHKGEQLKAMLSKAVLIPFATICLGCIARIFAMMSKVEKKLQALNRIVNQLAAKEARKVRMTGLQ